AERHLEEVHRYSNGLTDNCLKRQWQVFRALNAIKLHEAGFAYQSREALRAYVDPIVSMVETWASLGPLLRPYLGLLQAELERVLGDERQARCLYLDALNLARGERYVFLEGYL